MSVYRKNTIRWTLNGKRVLPNTPQAKHVAIPSKRFYGTLRTYDGKRKQMPLCEDKDTSRTLLKRLQLDEDRKRSIGLNKQDEERGRPITDLIAEYETHLIGKNNTPDYVVKTIQRINALIQETKTKTLNNLDVGRISATLNVWRKRKRKPLGIVSTNHYTRSIKSFSRWLWVEGKTPTDMLLSLRMLNAKADRKHVRRALTRSELTRLIETTATSKKTLLRLSPTDRAMLYAIASYTGLRASEIASLTPSAFDLDARTVNVQACYSKRRRADTLPLHVSLVERLRLWLTGREKLWHGLYPSKRVHLALMVRRDLKRAGIEYRTDKGVVDFHALRHTFITQLARSGVFPAQAKELARHSTITLTMDAYTHCETEELRTALDCLPSL